LGEFQSKKRCSRAAFDKYAPKARVPLFWAPVDVVSGESGGEELFEVRDLVEWEGLSFAPPDFDLGLRELEIGDLSCSD